MIISIKICARPHQGFLKFCVFHVFAHQNNQNDRDYVFPIDNVHEDFSVRFLALRPVKDVGLLSQTEFVK